MKIVGTSQAFSTFFSRLWRGFLIAFFPLLFPPVLHLLSPSMPLFTKCWEGHHLSWSGKVLFEIVYLRLGFKPKWQGLCAMLSHSVLSDCNLKKRKQSLSHVRLFATPWTVAYEAPPSMEFSRQECWSGLPLIATWVWPKLTMPGFRT